VCCNSEISVVSKRSSFVLKICAMSNLKGSTIPNSNNVDVKKGEMLKRTALIGNIKKRRK